jgi:hypothetical protein
MPRRLLLWTVSALAAVAFLAGCTSPGIGDTTAGARTPRPAAPVLVSPHGQAARAVRAVDVFARALRDGDVERLCRPGAILTPAVVASMNEGGESCEASLERSDALHHPPTLTVVRLAFEPGLARTRVRVGAATTIPLDVVRSGRRWLVSFSGGADPVAAVRQAVGS